MDAMILTIRGKDELVLLGSTTVTDVKLKPSLTSKEVKRMIKQKEKDELFKVLMNN